MPVTSARRQAGQSLFELAVSIAIGILIIGMSLKLGLALLQRVLGMAG